MNMGLVEVINRGINSGNTCSIYCKERCDDLPFSREERNGSIFQPRSCLRIFGKDEACVAFVACPQRQTEQIKRIIRQMKEKLNNLNFVNNKKGYFSPHPQKNQQILPHTHFFQQLSSYTHL